VVQFDVANNNTLFQSSLSFAMETDHRTHLHGGAELAEELPHGHPGRSGSDPDPGTYSPSRTFTAEIDDREGATMISVRTKKNTDWKENIGNY